MSDNPLNLPPGYRTRQAKSGHLEVVRPDGKPLRARGGLPIKVSLTPSDWRTRRNEAARIRRAISDNNGGK